MAGDLAGPGLPWPDHGDAGAHGASRPAAAVPAVHAVPSAHTSEHVALRSHRPAGAGRARPGPRRDSPGYRPRLLLRAAYLRSPTYLHAAHPRLTGTRHASR